ncbi:hypothetical protein MPC1_1770002 [Methylocella tundrae]|nr:hypothetical protein MPC1_1770002 [Methylocella tundrae]
MQFLAGAGRTRRDIGSPNQELEVGIAVLAFVSVERHKILALLVDVTGTALFSAAGARDRSNFCAGRFVLKTTMARLSPILRRARRSH